MIKPDNDSLSFSSLVEITSKMKILYIEDEETVRVKTLKMLENYFDNITVAHNGKEGLSKFKDDDFNIIFTDLNMPQMDGISMIENIRSFDTHTPVVILSAYDDTEYLLQTINFGIDGYILKPYGFDQINDVIKKIISMYKVDEKPDAKVELEYGFIWDKDDECLFKNNEIVKLTKNEVTLLKCLNRSGNNPMSNKEIEKYIFDDEIENNKRVRNIISRLKIKLDAALIDVNYGFGYRLKKLNQK